MLRVLIISRVATALVLLGTCARADDHAEAVRVITVANGLTMEGVSNAEVRIGGKSDVYVTTSTGEVSVSVAPDSDLLITAADYLPRLVKARDTMVFTLRPIPEGDDGEQFILDFVHHGNTTWYFAPLVMSDGRPANQVFVRLEAPELNDPQVVENMRAGAALITNAPNGGKVFTILRQDETPPRGFPVVHIGVNHSVNKTAWYSASSMTGVVGSTEGWVTFGWPSYDREPPYRDTRWAPPILAHELGL